MVKIIFLLKNAAVPRSGGRPVISIDSSKRPRGTKGLVFENQKEDHRAQVNMAIVVGMRTEGSAGDRSQATLRSL